MAQQICRKKFTHYILPLFFAFLFVSLPSFTQAAIFGIPLPSDALNAIIQVFTNIAQLTVFLFTGIPIVMLTLAGLAYTGLVLMSGIMTALYLLIQPLIQATLDITVIPGGANTAPIVQQGWEISRAIASVFFIVILAFIGLATILGMQTYQVRKTLPALLIMALLLNFSGLVVGFVVDMANLLSIGFINNLNITLTDNPFINELNNAKDGLLGQLSAIFNSNILFDKETSPLDTFTEAFLTPVLAAAAKVIFYALFSAMLVAIFFLYIIRVGILWLLTILAPLAFASYVLPATRKFWTQWWQNLIQWAFMAFPMSFFLYLAMRINNIPTSLLNLPNNPGSWFDDVLIGFIQPTFILLFLFVGFTMSITFVPSAAQGLVSKGGSFLQKTAAPATGAFLGKRLGPQMEKFGSALMARKTPEEIEKMTGLQKFAWGARRAIGAPTGALLEMGGREAAGRAAQYEKAVAERKGAKVKGLSDAELLNRYKLAVTDSGRDAALEQMTPEKLKEFKDAGKIKKEDVIGAAKRLWDLKRPEFASNNYSDEIAAAIEPAKWKAAQDLIAKAPLLRKDGKDLLARRMAETARNTIEILRKAGRTREAIAIGRRYKLPLEQLKYLEQGETLKGEVAQIFTKGVKDPTQLSAGAFKSEAFIRAAIDSWTGDKIGRAATHFGKEVADAFQKEINKKGKDIFKDNGRLALWLTGGAATNAGMHLPKELLDRTQKDVKQEIIDARIASEKSLAKQTVAIVNAFRGREQLLFRDYHRPGTTDEMRKAIEGAIKSLSRTMPTKEEVNSRIGKAEQVIQRNTQNEIVALQKRRSVEETYQTAGRPTSGPRHTAWVNANQEIQEQLNEIRGRIRTTEQDQVDLLTRLWETKKSS